MTSLEANSSSWVFKLPEIVASDESASISTNVSFVTVENGALIFDITSLTNATISIQLKGGDLS